MAENTSEKDAAVERVNKTFKTRAKGPEPMNDWSSVHFVTPSAIRPGIFKYLFLSRVELTILVEPPS